MFLRVILVVFLIGVQIAFAQQKPDPEWINQKYSMFIHWGLYSELGGVWKGEPVRSGYSEQIQSFASVSKEDYDAVAKRFNPEKWDAEEVVRLAVSAGMRAIVFTSKHHDGFCMYHSKYTDYNIVDATPFKRDVMKELATACKKYGIRFGVYFSLIDWHFPGTKISSHNADPISPEHHAYNLKQVEEILTQYGPVSEFWFDMGSLTAEQSQDLYDLVTRLQPQCMVSGRLGNDRGDFCVMGDNQYPNYKIGVPWQTPASFFAETWGYRSWQERGSVEAKVKEKLLGLVKVVSRGGNYLLNIGPRGDGSVVEFEREVLVQMGLWLRKYGKAIYNTRANPFEGSVVWGDMTRTADKLNLFIEKLPKNREIRLCGIQGKARGASLVASRYPLRLDQAGDTLMLYIPETVSPDRGMIVAEIEFEEPYRVVSGKLLHINILTSDNAMPVYAYSSMDYYSSFRSVVGRQWYFYADQNSVKPKIVYTENDKNRSIVLTVDGEEQKVCLQGGKVEPLQVVPGSIRWRDVYKMEASESFFGLTCLGEGKEIDSLEESDVLKWEKIHRFGFGEYTLKTVDAKHSVYLLFAVESDVEQHLLVEFANPDGLQVVLNGKTIRKQVSVGGTMRDREIVLLSLRKGLNQLLVKYHNRYGNKIEYGMNPNIPQQVYRLELAPMKLGLMKGHVCSLRLANPVNKNSGMGLWDIDIDLGL